MKKYEKMALEHNALVYFFLLENYALGYFPCFFQIYFGFLKNGQGKTLSKMKKSYRD